MVGTLTHAAPLQTHDMHNELTSLPLSTCRQQLERSESLRVAGQRALAELKAEFEALTGELVAEGQLSGGDAAAAVAHAASVAADQQQRGPSGELGQHADKQVSILLDHTIRLQEAAPWVYAAFDLMPLCQCCRLTSSQRQGSGNAEQSRGHSADGAARAVSHLHMHEWYYYLVHGRMLAQQHLEPSDQHKRVDDLRIEWRSFADESVLRRLEQCLDKVEGSKPG